MELPDDDVVAFSDSAAADSLPSAMVTPGGGGAMKKGAVARNAAALVVAVADGSASSPGAVGEASVSPKSLIVSGKKEREDAGNSESVYSKDKHCIVPSPSSSPTGRTQTEHSRLPPPSLFPYKRG